MSRIVRYPAFIVGIILSLTVFFAFQLPRSQLDNNTFRFIPEDDPARLAMKQVEDQYGSQISILVGFRRSYGSILERDFLLKLREFVSEAEDLEFVESVVSIMNVDYISSNDEDIKIESLVADDFAGGREEIRELRSRLASWDLFENSIISEDGLSTQVLVNLSSISDDGDDESVVVYDQLRALAKATNFSDTEVFVTGMPAFTSVMNNSMRADLVVLIPLVVIVVLGILFLSFRTIGGVVLPMLTVLISTIWSIGLMALFGVKLSMLATVLPVILVAVGSAYGIHIVNHYYDEMAGKKNLSKSDHSVIIFHVLNRIAMPVFLAALTTFAGFVSLSFTSVVPIREFGIFASIGVLVAFIVAVFLIPSLLLLKGPPKGQSLQNKQDTQNTESSLDQEHLQHELDSDFHLESDPISRSVANFFQGIVSHRNLVCIAVASLIALGLYGISTIKIDNIIIEYFKDDTEIAKSDRFIREDFAGSKTVSVIVRGQNPGDLSNPRILKAMDDLSVYLEREIPEVGKVTGYHQLIKRINQVLNASEDASGLKPQVALSLETSDSDSDFGFGDWSSFEEETAEDSASSLALTSSEEQDTNQHVNPASEEMISRLAAVEMLSEALANSSGTHASAQDLVLSLQRATNYQGAAYYEIPSEPLRYAKDDEEGLQKLIGNYLVLLSGDLSDWADDGLEPQEARMTIQLRTLGQNDTQRVVDAISDFVEKRFPAGYEVKIAGSAMVEQALNSLVVSSQLTSIIISLLLVFIILSVFYRSVVAGFLGVFTLGLAIMSNFMMMGFLGIELNIGTALVGSICVGTGIDYIIHYLAAYKHEIQIHSDEGRVLRRTFLTSGKAILFNAVSVGAGFAVLILSQFNMLAYMGMLVAIAMLVSSIISLTVLPVLILWIKPTFLRKV